MERFAKLVSKEVLALRTLAVGRRPKLGSGQGE